MSLLPSCTNHSWVLFLHEAETETLDIHLLVRYNWQNWENVVSLEQETRLVPGVDYTLETLCSREVSPEVHRTQEALQEMVDLAHRELESPS